MSHAERIERLRSLVRDLESVAVAFSGGVDSSVLLHVAHTELGDEAAGVIADSPSLPRRELAEARRVADGIGVRLHVVRTDELADERYLRNAGDRCYYCKAALFEVMEAWAREQGFAKLAFGEITDDFADDRPGKRAANEFGVVAPLSAAGLGKEDVRRYAEEVGLPVARKPASACLASRIPVGTRVSRERLERVERAEDGLHDLGLLQVRVRDHGARARLEVGRDEHERARADLPRIREALARLGFDEVELAIYRAPAER